MFGLEFHDWLFIGLTVCNVLFCLHMRKRDRLDANEDAYEQGFDAGFDKGWDAGWDECEECDAAAEDDTTDKSAAE